MEKKISVRGEEKNPRLDLETIQAEGYVIDFRHCLVRRAMLHPLQLGPA